MPIKSLKNALKNGLMRPAKRRAKQLLLRWLARLDESAVHNLRRSDGESQAFPCSGEKETETSPIALNQDFGDTADSASEYANPATAQSTLVLNDTASLVHEQMLAIYFRAIFAGAADSPALRDLWSHLLERPERWTDYPTLVTTLRKYCERQETRSKSREFAALAQRVERHEAETKRNQAAYRTDDKWNPSAVFWPDPTGLRDPRSLHETLPIARVSRRFDMQTPIGSAGSCFAMEIAHRLQSGGFNYVVTEPNPDANGHSPSCAKWGIIFNTPSFRQLVEKSFGVRRLPRLLWSHKVAGRVQFRDPFREDIVFDSMDEYEATYDEHLRAAKQALLEAKVFVLTLGMNEIWRIKGSGAVLSRAPWRIAGGVVEHEVLSVEQNVRELQRMLDLWRSYNPEIELILSVSPVPLHATFRGHEQHVVAANAHSKATLRLAAEEFCQRNPGVHYFPSYESVMYCTKDAWQSDQRHVSRQAVDKVMELFAEMFLAGETDVRHALPAAEKGVLKCA